MTPAVPKPLRTALERRFGDKVKVTRTTEAAYGRDWFRVENTGDGEDWWAISDDEAVGGWFASTTDSAVNFHIGPDGTLPEDYATTA